MNDVASVLIRYSDLQLAVLQLEDKVVEVHNIMNKIVFDYDISFTCGLFVKDSNIHYFSSHDGHEHKFPIRFMDEDCSVDEIEKWAKSIAEKRNIERNLSVEAADRELEEKERAELKRLRGKYEKKS